MMFMRRCGKVTVLFCKLGIDAFNCLLITNVSDVNGCVKCWKYKYDTCLYTIREKRQTLGLSYHPRNPKFVTYGDDCILNMYDEEAQTQERAFHGR